MQKSIKEIQEWQQLLRTITTSSGSDKLNYAIAKLEKRLKSAVTKHEEKFNEDVQDIRVKLASVYPDDFEQKEKRGQFILDERGQMTFTRDSTKEFSIEANSIKDIYLDTTVTIEGESFLANEDWDRVKDIPLIIKEELGGVLFKPFEI